MDRDLVEMGHKLSSKYVLMERTYLNGWQTFFERTSSTPTIITGLLKDSKTDSAALYTAMRALNAARFEAIGLRKKIGEKFQGLRDKRCRDTQALIDGVVGLAGCKFKPD